MSSDSTLLPSTPTGISLTPDDVLSLDITRTSEIIENLAPTDRPSEPFTEQFLFHQSGNQIYLSIDKAKVLRYCQEKLVPYLKTNEMSDWRFKTSIPSEATRNKVKQLLVALLNQIYGFDDDVSFIRNENTSLLDLNKTICRMTHILREVVLQRLPPPVPTSPDYEILARQFDALRKHVDGEFTRIDNDVAATRAEVSGLNSKVSDIVESTEYTDSRRKKPTATAAPETPVEPLDDFSASLSYMSLTSTVFSIGESINSSSSQHPKSRLQEELMKAYPGASPPQYTEVVLDNGLCTSSVCIKFPKRFQVTSSGCANKQASIVDACDQLYQEVLPFYEGNQDTNGGDSARQRLDILLARLYPNLLERPTITPQTTESAPFFTTINVDMQFSYTRQGDPCSTKKEAQISAATKFFGTEADETMSLSSNGTSLADALERQQIENDIKILCGGVSNLLLNFKHELEIPGGSFIATAVMECQKTYRVQGPAFSTKGLAEAAAFEAMRETILSDCGKFGYNPDNFKYNAKASPPRNILDSLVKKFFPGSSEVCCFTETSKDSPAKGSATTNPRYVASAEVILLYKVTGHPGLRASKKKIARVNALRVLLAQLQRYHGL